MNLDVLHELAAVRALIRSAAARSVRRGAGISQGELAAAADVSVASISRWERGLRIPRGDAALRYGRVLELLMGRR